MSYPADEFRALLRRGPSPGEDFFRLKATGTGETRWVNVTPAELEAIATVLDDDAPDVRVAYGGNEAWAAPAQVERLREQGLVEPGYTDGAIIARDGASVDEIDAILQLQSTDNDIREDERQ